MAEGLALARAPAAIRTVRVGGHELAYRRTGLGTPVLLVHGMATHSFLWGPVVERLDRLGRLDLVAVDLLGCGASAQPAEASYSLRAQADLLSRFCAELELGRVHLVGHDLGGGIGQLMAVRYPGLLRSLVLVNSIGYDLWPVQPVRALRTPVVRQVLLALVLAGALAPLVRRGLVHKALATPELLAQFLAPLRRRGGRRAMLGFARSLDGRCLLDLGPDLRRLRLPTTVVWGLADAYLPFETAERLVADVPEALLVQLPEAGHFSPLDQPDQVADAILAHLARAGAGRPGR